MGGRVTTVKASANRSAQGRLEPGGFHFPFGILLALIATIHFTLVTEVHQLSHPQTSAASSACGHEGCAPENTPTEEPDSSSSPDCQTCEALASAHGDLLHVQILLSRPIHGALQVSSDATLIDFQVKKERPGRSPPRA